MHVDCMFIVAMWYSFLRYGHPRARTPAFLLARTIMYSSSLCTASNAQQCMFGSTTAQPSTARGPPTAGEIHATLPCFALGKNRKMLT